MRLFSIAAGLIAAASLLVRTATAAEPAEPAEAAATLNAPIASANASALFGFDSIVTPDLEQKLDGFFHKDSGHTNNWAVLVSTSRFWFNYRHQANALAMYRTMKRLGIPDSNIILMLADDVACDPRNSIPGAVYSYNDHRVDLFGTSVEVDFRGYEVTVENFIRVLTGRQDASTPRSKRLLTDDRSNIFIFMTGHGGEDFLKFQDAEEINSYDIAHAFATMRERRRYREIFFMIDTCQATSMYSKFSSPDILSVGSSQVGTNSLARGPADQSIGVFLIDEFTYFNLEQLEKVDRDSGLTLKQLFDSYDPMTIQSTPGYEEKFYNRNLDEVKVTDFFGAVHNIELTPHGYPLRKLDSPPPSPLPETSSVLTQSESDQPSSISSNPQQRNKVPAAKYLDAANSKSAEQLALQICTWAAVLALIAATLRPSAN